MQRVLFIGGPGNISSTAAEAILARGDDLAILTLPETDARGCRARIIRGNRDDADLLRRIAEEVKPDIVVDFVCFKPSQASASAAVFEGRVKQYVFVSTVDVYGYPLWRLPMPVDGEIRPQLSQYARDKYECERIFRDARHLPLTIFRPSYSFGVPFALHVFSRSGGKMLVARLRAGRPVIVPGDGTTLIHAGAAANTGRMVARVVGHDRSVGRAYNGAHEHVITHDQYIGLFAKALGVQPNIVHVPVELLLPYEMKLVPDNLLSELTRYSICFSTAEFMADFPDFRYETTLEEAAAEYVRVHTAGGSIPAATGTYEDRIAEAWRRAAAAFRP